MKVRVICGKNENRFGSLGEIPEPLKFMSFCVARVALGVRPSLQELISARNHMPPEGVRQSLVPAAVVLNGFVDCIPTDIGAVRVLGLGPPKRLRYPLSRLVEFD